MQAYEFQTVAQNGIIEIPTAISEKLTGGIKVIIMTDDRDMPDLQTAYNAIMEDYRPAYEELAK
jgi:hypothetical protein